MSNTKRTTLCSILAGLLLWLPAAVMAAPVNDSFDHFTTGFSLTGGHRAVECDACHTSGQFRGTPRECASCHNTLTNTGAVVKTSAHIQSNNACDVCHSTLAWDDVRRVNHMAVLGRCNSCHTIGGAASSRPPSDTIHSSVASNGTDCINCHRTSTWASVHFNHGANATGHFCDDCHNVSPKNGGIPATPTPSGHVGTGSFNCNDCHNTSSWRFNHRDASSDCLLCHGDGTNIATRKGAGHPSTTATCSLCHTTRNWNFSHSRVTGSCSDCHDGVVATGKPGNHFSTTLECNACHTTRAWTPASYGHQDSTYPPDHGWSTSCDRCHSGSPQSAGNVNVYDYSRQVRECIDCHYSDFRRKHSDSKLPAYQNCLVGCHEHSMRKF